MSFCKKSSEENTFKQSRRTVLGNDSWGCVQCPLISHFCRSGFSRPSTFLVKWLDIAIVRGVISWLTNLGAAKFWLRLLRLMSFPPCAEATSLKAMKKPYERGRKPSKSGVLRTHQHHQPLQIYREIQCYPLIQKAFSFWICQIPNLKEKNDKKKKTD